MIFWFIGQPGSGKTTLARMFKKHVALDGKAAIHIDGDDLRAMFKSGYTPEVLTEEYRKDQTRSLQRFVAYIADQGIIVIVSTVNGYRDVREAFKADRTDVVEVYVTKNEERGREQFNIPSYEPPEKDFVHIDTTGKSVEESFVDLCGAIIHYSLDILKLTRHAISV